MDSRTWFSTASTGFVHVVSAIAEDQLDRPGLGDWDVRSLLGHATRAYLTIETYLAAPSKGIALTNPADYYRAATTGLADPAQVAQRGRDAGAALGEEAVRAATDIARRVTDLVAGTADEAVAATFLGGMRLIDYLPTRAFELTVHGIDLARATGQPCPTQLVEAAGPALLLCNELVASRERVAILLALTGRQTLPSGFSVL